MVMLEGAVVVAVLAVLLYGTVLLVSRASGGSATLAGPGQWHVTHYDVRGQTRVVLQRTRPGSDRVLDEHVVATIPVGDPDYDSRFLAAMSAARERRAVFESEAE